MRRRHNRPGGSIFAGLLFLALGVILLIDNLGMVEIKPTLSQWWPLILVIIGIKHLVLFRGSSALVGALFWIGSGALFLSSTLGFLHISVPSLLWPVVLIWFGVFTVLGPGGHCNGAVDDRSKP
jgi:lia operon protein LiaF